MKFFSLSAALLFSPGCVTAGGTSAGTAAPLGGEELSTIKLEIFNRFLGATLVGKEEFAAAVVGHRFRYHDVAANILIERPVEVFHPEGSYELHGTRVISRGSYSFKNGIVSIECPETFAGLGKTRIFFRHNGRLYVTNASGSDGITVTVY